MPTDTQQATGSQWRDFHSPSRKRQDAAWEESGWLSGVIGGKSSAARVGAPGGARAESLSEAEQDGEIVGLPLPKRTAAQQQKKTERELLEIEAALLALLLVAVRKKSGGEDAIADALLKSAKRARALAIVSLSAELRAPAAARAVAGADKASAVADRAATARALKTSAVADRAAHELAASLAANASEARVRMIATTETVAAFEAERAREAMRIGEELDRGMTKRWDSTLDMRTCGRCIKLHGETIPALETFSAGRNPPLHPRCRCTVRYSLDG